MEINLRSMMWHRVGNLSGVNLQYSQYLDSLGKKVDSQSQAKNKIIHFVYLRYEIMNLIGRKKYLRTFIRNIRDSDETYIAVYDKKDIRPFLKDSMDTVGEVLGKFLRSLKNNFLFKPQYVSLNSVFKRFNSISDHKDDSDNF